LAKLSQKRVPKKGDIYLRELVYNKNKRIHCSQLRNLFTQQGVGTSEFETKPGESNPVSGYSIGYYQLAIEMTDPSTIKQCKARLIALINQEATAAQWNDSAKLQDQQTDDYRTVQKALKRTRDAIASTEPDLAEYIDKHLETGFWCIWREVI
jgi:hypothetical protein